jgi:hypothetical protein
MRVFTLTAPDSGRFDMSAEEVMSDMGKVRERLSRR